MSAYDQEKEMHLTLFSNNFVIINYAYVTQIKMTYKKDIDWKKNKT